MRKAIAIGCIVLGAMLLGALTPGTADAATDSVAATTAGIELGTAPVVRVASATSHHHHHVGLRPLLSALRPLFAVTFVVVAAGMATEIPSGLRSRLRSHTATRRGPPALA